MPMLSRTGIASRRRGVVLLAVLLIVVVLLLAVFEFGEWITNEDRATNGFQRAVQTRALADSGVNYTAAVLSNADAMTNTLNGNPYDNAQAFQSVTVTDAGKGRPGVFTVLSLLSPDDPNATSQPYRFGVADEAAKINVNALLALDNGKGQVGYNVLMDLPNMTEDVANSILDWLDPSSDTPRSDGAKDDYYSSLSPPYHCKNGPIDSLEELLLVKGVTPQLLFGNDRNRNGVLDPDEDDGSGQVDLGWSAYLTVYSREPNTDSQGNPRIYLNDSDLNTLATNLSTVLSSDMANYILAYRLYGPAPAAKAGTPASTYKPLSGSDQTTVTSQISSARSSSGKQKPQQIKSVYDLIGSSVNVTTGSGRSARTISLPCPLNDPGQLEQQLPLVLDETTTTLNTDLTPRINVNTASQTVLQALSAALPNTPLDDTDIQNILSTRPDPTANQAPDAIFQTPAWLLTEGNLSQATLKAIAPYITARSQVYRFQVLGYYQGGTGPVSRVEAVVDANNGRPRIVYKRDLTELGTGFDLNQIQAGQ